MNSVNSKLHLILFDCDGTLTDSHGAIVEAMRQAFVRCGLAVPDDEAVREVIGLSLQQAVERLSPDAPCHAEICEAYRERYVAAEAGLALYPGVIDTLKELRQRGYRLGIVTGKSRSGLLRVLEQFRIGHYFDVFRTADCCHSKPHPAMAIECMDEVGVVPERTSLVGDALFDMQMASAANVRAYGVSFGVEPAERLCAAGACDVVDDFPALLEYFPPLNSAAVASTISKMELDKVW